VLFPRAIQLEASSRWGCVADVAVSLQQSVAGIESAGYL